MVDDVKGSLLADLDRFIKVESYFGLLIFHLLRENDEKKRWKLTNFPLILFNYINVSLIYQLTLDFHYLAQCFMNFV